MTQAEVSFSSAEQLGPRPKFKDEKRAARSVLMRWVLVGYLATLALSMAVPFIVARFLSVDQASIFTETKQAMNGWSQGLFGILGVVVGFYFKESSSDGANG